MIRVKKITYDSGYPYRIEDSWGGFVCCDKEGLEEARKEIEKILEEIQNTP